MYRALSGYLESWLTSVDRKPLVIRGARQVGKTWIVRHLAKTCKKELVELNFEKQSYSSIFNTNDVQQVLLNLSAITNKKINPGQTLLFLDEIQAAPELFATLRWFAEDLPELAVVATGSLLEFVLAEHSFSMPVGRITYAYLEALSFEEFLLASSKQSLRDYLQAFHFDMNMPRAIHDELMNLFKEYIFIGGMPAVVSNWVKERSLQRVDQIQQDLLATYRDDFAKYKGRVDKEKLDDVMGSIPKMLSQKFVYSRVNKTDQTNAIKQALGLLEKARVCSRVVSSSANGIPLRAEVNEKYFKVVLLDTGLCCASLGLGLNQINSTAEISLINNGGIAEQVVGQQLKTIEMPYVEPALYYWRRDEEGSSAEIDYVIQHGNRIIPVEVKAGTTGTLKSLHIFMKLKKYAIAFRVNADLPCKTMVDVKDHEASPVQYHLYSIPFYLIGQIHRLLQQIID